MTVARSDADLAASMALDSGAAFDLLFRPHSGAARGVGPGPALAPGAGAPAPAAATAADHSALVSRAVLDVLGHPRYRGAYLPAWRIFEAIGMPLTPSVVRRSLQLLAADGRVERRRRNAKQMEWRLAPPP